MLKQNNIYNVQLSEYFGHDDLIYNIEQLEKLKNYAQQQKFDFNYINNIIYYINELKSIKWELYEINNPNKITNREEFLMNDLYQLICSALSLKINNEWLVKVIY